MEIKFVMLISLVAYSMVVSQAFMYLIALSNVQRQLPAPSYVELRQLLDKNFQVKFRWVIYACLISCLALAILSAGRPRGILFLSSTVALGALIIEILLALKGNMPINTIINTWTADNYPVNWKEYREKWLSIFAMRQVVTITGFVGLLIGAVFG